MKAVFLLSSIFSVLALLLIIVFLLIRGVPKIAEAGLFNFLFGRDWHPANKQYGAFPLIVGSIYVTAMSTAIGVSIGLFTAVFLYKFCPKKIVNVIRQMVNLLAGIPSVIYGLFGLLVIVPVFARVSPTAYGEGILSASLILSVMLLPTIVSISLESLYAVPNEYYEGALALGANKEQTVFKVMLPAAKSGVFAAVVLSIGRAVGETMAVAMVIGGGTPEVPNRLFQAVHTLTSNIASGALDATDDVLGALISTGVILMVFTLLINTAFSLIQNAGKRDKKNKKEKPRPAAEEGADGGQAG